MPLIQYRTYRPREEARGIIDAANAILAEYSEAGYNLTLRQLYYQFISRDLFPDSYVSEEGTKNNVKSYNKLGDIISNAREGGLIDWNFITDRGRQVESNPHWHNPRRFMDAVAPQFAIDVWRDQEFRMEVWVEKDALSEVIARACEPLDIPYMACKGYMSASAMWEAAHNRMLRHWNEYDQRTVVLHLGDHDPSGIDMTRDIEARLDMFSSQYDGNADNPCHIEVQRIALTMDQVQQYQPPPNPAKETDSRFAQYQELYGDESWELDALEPQTIVELIESSVYERFDRGTYEDSRQREADWRDRLEKIATHWDAVEAHLDQIDEE